jgi:hypothetical protein
MAHAVFNALKCSSIIQRPRYASSTASRPFGESIGRDVQRNHPTAGSPLGARLDDVHDVGRQRTRPALLCQWPIHFCRQTAHLDLRAAFASDRVSGGLSRISLLRSPRELHMTPDAGRCPRHQS